MATRRPATLDALAGITGVGAVKLDRFGRDFLAILTGDAPPPVHPARRKLAGAPAATSSTGSAPPRTRSSRGPDGLAKYLDCPPATLARIAESRPSDLAALAARARHGRSADRALRRRLPRCAARRIGWRQRDAQD